MFTLIPKSKHEVNPIKRFVNLRMKYNAKDETGTFYRKS